MFFFIATAPTEIYTLSLHDALPISGRRDRRSGRLQRPPDPEDGGGGDRLHGRRGEPGRAESGRVHESGDRKSTRLNSSHVSISYAVFCLKKKNKNVRTVPPASVATA